MAFRGLPIRGAVPAIEGSLRYPPTELDEAAGEPSFFRALPLPDLVEPDEVAFFSPPLEGLFTLLGWAEVPPDVVADFPDLAGLSGARIVRGPVDVPDLAADREAPRSFVSPVP